MPTDVDKNNWKTILLALVVFILEFVIFTGFINQVIPLFLLGILHGTIVAGLAYYTYLAKKREEDLRYPFLLLLSAAGTGPFGVAGFLLLVLLYPFFSYFSTPPERWFEELFPSLHQTSFSNIYQRVQSGWDDYSHINEVATFEDLFTCGSLSQKQAVLDAIVQDFKPDYARILKQALADSHNSVRIQAAAIMSKLDIDFSEITEALLERQKENPDDPKIILDLAKHYDRYATLGILDPIREREVAENAIIYYGRYLETDPSDIKSLFSIGRLLFLIEDYEQFLVWYEDYRQKVKVIPSLVQTWYFHALYKLQKYEELSLSLRGR